MQVAAEVSEDCACSPWRAQSFPSSLDERRGDGVERRCKEAARGARRTEADRQRHHHRRRHRFYGEFLHRRPRRRRPPRAGTRSPARKAAAPALRAAGIVVVDLNDVADLDLYIDGADEATVARHLIKGGGGALTREKIIASAARRFVCIVDDGKLVATLGSFPLPVEVIPMARALVARQLAAFSRRTSAVAQRIRPPTTATTSSMSTVSPSPIQWPSSGSSTRLPAW